MNTFASLNSEDRTFEPKKLLQGSARFQSPSQRGRLWKVMEGSTPAGSSRREFGPLIVFASFIRGFPSWQQHETLNAKPETPSRLSPRKPSKGYSRGRPSSRKVGPLALRGSFWSRMNARQYTPMHGRTPKAPKRESRNPKLETLNHAKQPSRFLAVSSDGMRFVDGRS